MSNTMSTLNKILIIKCLQLFLNIPVRRFASLLFLSHEPDKMNGTATQKDIARILMKDAGYALNLPVHNPILL